MDPAKKRKQPESALNEDPGSGDGSIPNWRAEVSQKVRQEQGAAIAWRLYMSPDAKIPLPMALTTAARVEGGFYKEATSEHDYRTRVSDYIQSIPRPPGILQAVPLDLRAEMGHLVNSEERPLARLRSHANSILPPQQQQQPLARSLSGGNTILPTQQQQQPLARSLSGGNTILLPRQQPQQQQSDFNELDFNELPKEILEELLTLVDHFF